MRLPALPELEAAAAALRAQYRALHAAAGAADPAAPTRLGDWRVADLVAHLAHGLTGVGEALAAPVVAGAAPAIDAWSYYDTPGPAAGPRAQRGLAAAGGPGAVAELAEAIAGFDPPTVDVAVRVEGGVLRLRDYLVTRMVEGVVHGLDLNAATGMVVAHDPVCLRTVTRLLAGRLARAHPGHALELRIPPHVALQCLAGPRHTRGTPPSTVEADPLAWIEVATGRRAFVSAVAEGAIRASGERSSLSAYLPLLS